MFVANDQMALGALRALHEAGHEIPRQVSVVGFDDIPEAQYFTPPLTTVRQDFAEIGRRALALMLEMMDAERRRAAVAGDGRAGADPALQHRAGLEPTNVNCGWVRPGSEPLAAARVSARWRIPPSR